MVERAYRVGVGALLGGFVWTYGHLHIFVALVTIAVGVERVSEEASRLQLNFANRMTLFGGIALGLAVITALRVLAPAPAPDSGPFGNPGGLRSVFVLTHVRGSLEGAAIRVDLWEHPKPVPRRLRLLERIATLGRLPVVPATGTDRGFERRRNCPMWRRTDILGLRVVPAITALRRRPANPPDRAR